METILRRESGGDGTRCREWTLHTGGKARGSFGGGVEVLWRRVDDVEHRKIYVPPPSSFLPSRLYLAPSSPSEPLSHQLFLKLKLNHTPFPSFHTADPLFLLEAFVLPLPLTHRIFPLPVPPLIGGENHSDPQPRESQLLSRNFSEPLG